MREAGRSRLPFGVLLLCVLVIGATAFVGTTDPKFRTTNFISGLPSNGKVGASGMVFQKENMFVMDGGNSCLYRFDASKGGVTSAALNCYNDMGGGFKGLALDMSGRLFVAHSSQGVVLELNPNDGKVVRRAAENIPGASNVAVDVVGGDLFVTGSDDSIYRFRQGKKEVYARLEGTEGTTKPLSFAPDGSLYTASKGSIFLVPYSHNEASVPKPLLSGLSDIKALALSPDWKTLTATQADGKVTQVKLQNRDTVTVLVGGSPSDNVIYGPDGCAYITQTDGIVKISNDDGTCGDGDLNIEAPPTSTVETVVPDIPPLADQLNTQVDAAEKRLSDLAGQLTQLQNSTTPEDVERAAQIRAQLVKANGQLERQQAKQAKIALQQSVDKQTRIAIEKSKPRTLDTMEQAVVLLKDRIAQLMEEKQTPETITKINKLQASLSAKKIKVHRMKEAWQISKKRIERSAKMKLSKPGGYDKAKSCVAMQELRLLELKGKHDAESKMERRRVEEKQQHCQTRLADLESTWQRRKKQVRASARSAAPKPPFLVDMENKISLMVRKLEGLTRKCRQEPTTRCRERMSGLSERIAGVESKIGGATKFWRKQAELARLRKRLATKERQLREVHARVARYLTGRATAQLQTKDPVALSLSISKLTSKITNGRDRQRNLLKDIEHIQTLIKQVEDELETARLDFRPVKPNVPTRVFKKLANAANKLKAEVDSLVDRRDPDSRARLVKLRRRLRRIARRLMRAKARWQAKKAHYLRRRSQELVLGCIRKFHRVEVDIQSKTTKLGIFLFRKGRESTDTRAGLREDIRVLQAKARQLRPQCKSFAKEQEHQSQNHLRSTNEELSDKKRDIAVAGGRLTAARSDSTPAGKVLRRSLRTKLIDLNDEKTRLQQLVDKIMEQNQVDRKAYAVRERAAMKAASDAGDALEALREAEAKRATLRDLKEQQTDLALLTKKKRELEKRELHDKQQEESRAAAKKSSDLQEALKMARERKNELLHEAHDLRRKREHDERQRDERREMEREAKELLQKQTLAALKDASTSLHHRPGHVALPWGKKNCCARYNSDHPDKCRSFPDKRRPDARARRNRFDTCFGAIGRKCKGSPEAPAKAISFNKFSVFVSVGSILHDNCCLKYPHGYMCAHGVTDKDSDFATPWDDECACVAEYLKSSDNLRAKRFWNATLHRRGDLRPSRDVRTAYVRDSGGKWNRARGNGETISSRWVMAPAGTMLDCPDCTTGQYEGLVAGDSQFCASGKFSKVGVVEGHPEATHYGVCGTGAKIVPDIRRPNPELNQGKTVDRALVEKKARRLQKFFRRLQKQLRECRDRGQEDSDSCQELRRLYRKVKAKLKRLARQLSKGLSRPQRRRLRWKLRDARDKLQRLRVKAKKCADDNLEDTEHCKKIVQAVARLKELIRKLRRSIRKGKRVLAKVCELEADERNSLRGKIKSEKDSLEDAEEQLEECRSTHPDNEREGCLSERRSALTLRRHTRHMRRELHRAVRNCKLTVQEQEQLRDKLAVAKKDSTKVGQSIEEECAKFDDETGPQCRKLFRRRKELRRRIRFLERVLNKEEKEKPPKPQSKSYRAMRRHQKKELKALQERMVKVSVVYKECKARGDDSEACSKATHEYDHLRRATKGLRKKLNRTFKHVALSFSKRRALRRKLRKMQAEHARLSQKVRDCAGQDSDECSHSQFLLRNLKHKLDRIRVRLNYEGPVCSLAKIDGLKAKRNRLRRRVRRARRRARECDGNSDCVRKYYSKVDRLTDRLTHVQSRLELCRPNYRPSVDHLKRSMERIRKQIRDSQQALSTAKDDYTRSRIQAYLKRLSRTLRTLKLQLKAAKLRRRMESLLQRLQSVPEDSEEYKKLIKSLRSVRAQAKKADLEKEAAKAGEKVHRNHSQMKLQVMRRIEELEQKVKKHPNEPRYERQLQKSRETLASVVQGLPAALKRARFQATLKTQLRWLRRSINSVTRKLNSLDKSSKKFDRALRRRFAKPYSQYLDLKVKYASILIRSLRHQARRLGKLRIREQRTKTKLEEMRERLNSSSTEEDKSKFSRWLDDLKRMKSRVKRQLVQDSQRFYSTAKVTSSRLVKMMGRHQDDASNLNRWREHNDNEPAQDRLQELINDTKEAKSQVNSALEKATKFVKKGERSVQENPTRAVEENHQRSNSTTS